MGLHRGLAVQVFAAVGPKGPAPAVPNAQLLAQPGQPIVAAGLVLPAGNRRPQKNHRHFMSQLIINTFLPKVHHECRILALFRNGVSDRHAVCQRMVPGVFGKLR